MQQVCLDALEGRLALSDERSEVLTELRDGSDRPLQQSGGARDQPRRIRNRIAKQGADQQILHGVRHPPADHPCAVPGWQGPSPPRRSRRASSSASTSRVAIVNAKAALDQAIRDYEAHDSESDVIVRDLRRTVIGDLRRGSPKLSDFGFALPSAAWTPEMTTAAVAKRKATREARRTVGPKAKLAIKGVVEPRRPLTAEPATPTTPLTPKGDPHRDSHPTPALSFDPLTITPNAPPLRPSAARRARLARRPGRPRRHARRRRHRHRVRPHAPRRGARRPGPGLVPPRRRRPAGSLPRALRSHPDVPRHPRRRAALAPPHGPQPRPRAAARPAGDVRAAGRGGGVTAAATPHASLSLPLRFASKPRTPTPTPKGTPNQHG